MEPTHDKKVNLLHRSAKKHKRKTQTQKGADLRPGRAPKKPQRQPTQTVEAPRPEIIDLEEILIGNTLSQARAPESRHMAVEAPRPEIIDLEEILIGK